MKPTAFAVRLAALMAATLLGLAGSAFYDPHAMAQTARSAGPNLMPRQSVEMIAPAATVTSTVHYQAQIILTCSSPTQICSGNFVPPGQNRQLNVTRVSCVVGTTSGHSILNGLIALYRPNGVLLLQEMLSGYFSDKYGVYHTFTSAVDLQFVDRQYMSAVLRLDFASGDPTANGSCTATGTLSTLG